MARHEEIPTLCIWCGPEGHPEGAGENGHRTSWASPARPPELVPVTYGAHAVGTAVQLRTQRGVGHVVGVVLAHYRRAGAALTGVRWGVQEDEIHREDIHYEDTLVAAERLCDLPPLDCGRPDWLAQYRYRQDIFACSSEAEQERFCGAAEDRLAELCR